MEEVEFTVFFFSEKKCQNLDHCICRHFNDVIICHFSFNYIKNILCWIVGWINNCMRDSEIFYTQGYMGQSVF